MNIFNVSQSVGEIVAIMPKASEVFKELSIDFCCGGHRKLEEVIKEQGLSQEEVLKKLDKAYEDTRRLAGQLDYRTFSLSELIDYIENTHHTYMYRALPQISELTATILRVHGSAHTELFKVHKLYHNLKTEIEQHLIKEEEVVFPLIKKYEAVPSKELNENISRVVGETEEEHETAGGVLKELRKITNDYTVPEGVCATYERTYDALKALESDLFQHIHLENNILFRKLEIKV